MDKNKPANNHAYDDVSRASVDQQHNPPSPAYVEFHATQVAAYFIWLHKCEDMAHFNDPDTNWRDAETLRRR